MEAASKSNLKKACLYTIFVVVILMSKPLDQISLELGGKSPHLIFESADLDQAANWAALGILYNTGQDCTAGSRVYVQESIYDKFVALLVSKANELAVGDGFDPKTAAGPVVCAISSVRV
jgi:aldehyde dehydrogenase (NAD+)